MTKSVSLAVLSLFVFALASPAQTVGKPTEPPTPKLEDAFAAFHKGISSDKPDERSTALKGILFDKKDVEALVPKHAERLWKVMGPGREEYLKHVDDIAKEMTKHGPLTNVEVIDIRKAERPTSHVKRLREILPKDIPVCELFHRHKDGGGNIIGFAFVNKKWVFFPGLDGLPNALDQIK